MSRSRENQGEAHRGKAGPNRRAAAGPTADKPGHEVSDKVPPEQAEAIKGLNLGARGASGRVFKEHGSPPDKPIVPPRPPMFNESGRTDQDRRGGRKKN